MHSHLIYWINLLYGVYAIILCTAKNVYFIQIKHIRYHNDDDLVKAWAKLVEKSFFAKLVFWICTKMEKSSVQMMVCNIDSFYACQIWRLYNTYTVNKISLNFIPRYMQVVLDPKV